MVGGQREPNVVDWKSLSDVRRIPDEDRPRDRDFFAHGHVGGVAHIAVGRVDVCGGCVELGGKRAHRAVGRRVALCINRAHAPRIVLVEQPILVLWLRPRGHIVDLVVANQRRNQAAALVDFNLIALGSGHGLPTEDGVGAARQVGRRKQKRREVPLDLEGARLVACYILQAPRRARLQKLCAHAGAHIGHRAHAPEVLLVVGERLQRCEIGGEGGILLCCDLVKGLRGADLEYVVLGSFNRRPREARRIGSLQVIRRRQHQRRRVPVEDERPRQAGKARRVAIIDGDDAPVVAI